MVVETTSPEKAVMPPRLERAGAPDRWYGVALFIALLAIALVIRVSALPLITFDYSIHLSYWYEYLSTHGGFLALRDKFANYNVAYLYLLAALTYLPVPALAGIKWISIGFDLTLAYFTYLIVSLRYPARWVGGLAAITVLLLPTVWMNSAMWGQADSIYATFCVAGAYFLMVRRPWLACLLVGSGLAVKLQAVFLLPLLVTLAVVRYLPWRTLIAVPLAYLGWALPAALLGHDVRDLLLVYLDQVDLFPHLTFNAPTVYQFFRIQYGTEILRQVGVAFTAGLVLLVILLVLKSRRSIDAERVLLLAVLFAILVPYFLPGMHERYFYLADVLCVVLAFVVPRMLWVPVLVQASSALSYVSFLFWKDSPGESVDQRYLAVVMLAALLLVVREWGRSFGLRESLLGSEPSR